MKRDKKQILLKYLSDALSYDVKCRIDGDDEPKVLRGIFVEDEDNILLDFEVEYGDIVEVYISEVRPYLRPMSSMTKEEEEEMAKMSTLINSITLAKELGEWLNAHHFDYRGLIPMGLALEARESMYKQ